MAGDAPPVVPATRRGEDSAGQSKDSARIAGGGGGEGKGGRREEGEEGGVRRCVGRKNYYWG